MRKRRWVDISIDILESALTPKTKTRLMYKSNLNFARFNAYFSDFLQKGLLEETNAEGNAIYVTSEQGRTLLIALKKADMLFSDVPAQPLFVLR
jgi:predicted transcriptional regulator